MTVTERIGEGRVVDLPPEAGDLDATPFEPNDAWLQGAAPDQQKTAMWRWFATRYESPITAVPHDDQGEFLFLDGGPYHADEVLHDRFAAFVPREAIDALLEAVQAEAGNTWAPKSIDRFGG